ncbi:hypothetical protein CN563_19820 [Bacillus sp. AFS026049]|nr:hypothetical protein CN563_19820 [Bacillus sp. AFS026049]
MLLATIIMQRKEIKISQQGIVELIKQTEASVKQAEEARKETQITNAFSTSISFLSSENLMLFTI